MFLQVLKWNFTTPRQEFVDQLKDQIKAAGFNTSLQIQMFHSDFKQHLKAIDTLAKYLDSDVPGVISNLDLIFKWVTLQFFETNPLVLLKSLEYLNKVFVALGNYGYTMHDLEALCLIPYLIKKVGDPNDQVRAGIETMFKNIYQVYPVSKLATYLPPTKAETKKPSVSGKGSKEKDANVDMSPPCVPNDLKKTRFRDENKLKVRDTDANNSIFRKRNNILSR